MNPGAGACRPELEYPRGRLELVNPQAGVARALSLLGVDQAIEVRDGTNAGADPER